MAEGDLGYGSHRVVSTGTNFTGNQASGSGEAGFYVGDSPDAATVVTGNVQVQGNLVRSNNKFCAGTDEAPPLSGIGIALVGATDSLVSGNVTTANNSDQGAVPGGGIVLLSAAGITGGSNLANDAISHNVAVASRPSDIFWDGSGGGTVSFPGNVCRTSQPAWICRAGSTGVPA